MRKYKFKLVENYIALFKKLVEAIELELKATNSDFNKTSEYLNTCQQKAIELGEFIEQQEGLGHATVKGLEDFCELLYEVNEDILSERGLSADSAKLRLGNGVNKIEESAKSDIEIQTQVVFLPYKASMWDSLETVWKRRSQEPGTQALVIPIPYFDRNEDGSVKEMHFEGLDYPEDVPVVDFQKFQFEAEHPDEVYIHNPYDDLNIVTSVHPYFYSENIKKWTDKLIYIPYFVLADPDPTDEKTLEHIAGYALSKGVVNADEVIVQSENMKKAYVEVLTRRFGEDSRETWENKIKGTGSPKIEKLLAMKEQDIPLPDDWQKVIMKPDGTKKKIILYNTSLVAFLNAEEKMVTKIKDALQVFKENKDDVALLWRPHPLTMATLESMMPDLCEDYKAIVEEYKKEGWGIYDDSPDMDRAIIVSDAYYGDGSSLVQLYELLEKPIMIQNADVLCCEEG
ncbi:hypothetical protein [Pseudobutyrivibrio sp. YE44]|uniref:hypothetical protein n=1 Tax=Pseudobutyrivibrio sp. YE44 TaxID=1520802 RepID=UPI000B82B0DA|nr:hypothetical protein [Pseudobutyrivibrio sp. YE44]